jgi:hypothetical protein
MCSAYAHGAHRSGRGKRPRGMLSAIVPDRAAIQRSIYRSAKEFALGERTGVLMIPATVVLVCADEGAEQLGVVQQVHVADVLLADAGMRGLPDPGCLVLVAEQEAGC